MRKIAYLQLVLIVLASGTAMSQCSNGSMTVANYSPIQYLTLPRIARWEYDVKGKITLRADGRHILSELVVVRRDGERAVEGKDPIEPFLTPVKTALSSCTFVNETGNEQSVPLFVEFRLMGDMIYGDDPGQRNLVMLREDRLWIRVIAKPRGGVMFGAKSGETE